MWFAASSQTIFVNSQSKRGALVLVMRDFSCARPHIVLFYEGVNMANRCTWFQTELWLCTLPNPPLGVPAVSRMRWSVLVPQNIRHQGKDKGKQLTERNEGRRMVIALCWSAVPSERAVKRGGGGGFMRLDGEMDSMRDDSCWIGVLRSAPPTHLIPAGPQVWSSWTTYRPLDPQLNTPLASVADLTGVATWLPPVHAGGRTNWCLWRQV